ncbi:polar amino acid transport system permease protein [Microvirga flocculans]|uniref:Polar amino acid transport system permease protein n=1 Tax=Microvirga flocculans TaxID=217168 RepID=A0A7W6IF13_9HYPH|nr:amino acid ABC transporter permease [Microvirga flocculans]MBB4040272.1 polar amino acid transport system permease protein [Microvirga flocculans]
MSIFDTFLNWKVFVQTLPLLLSGLTTTLTLGVTAIILGFVGGLALALVRLYASPPFRQLSIAYIDVFRSIPILVLLVVIYYALPFVGLRLSPFGAAASALSLVSAAYSAEIFRAGIEAVPKGQFEAAYALGLSPWRLMGDVVLPQALKIVIPPITSNSINVMKDTALASVVAMPDLLKQATQAQALAANPTPLISAAFIYILILLPLVRLVGVFEKRLAGRGR